jgi:monosaccharide-transporting ATPase
VYQEVNLCPNLSVAENIFIGRYPRKLRRHGRLARHAAARRALLERMQVDIDVDAAAGAAIRWRSSRWWRSRAR